MSDVTCWYRKLTIESFLAESDSLFLKGILLRIDYTLKSSQSLQSQSECVSITILLEESLSKW